MVRWNPISSSRNGTEFDILYGTFKANTFSIIRYCTYRKIKFFLLNIYTPHIIAYVRLNYLRVPWQRSFLFLCHGHIFICVIHRNQKRLHFNLWFSNKLSHYLIFFCTVTDIFEKLLRSSTKDKCYWFALTQMATESKGPPLLCQFSTYTIGENISIHFQKGFLLGSVDVHHIYVYL